MIVIDASAMIDALVGRDASRELLDAMAGDLSAPHLLDIEVLSALRGLELAGKLASAAADAARVNFFAFQITRYPARPLADRIWLLRHQFTSYDAAYLAIAEALEAPLHTCDAKLDTTGHRAQVIVHRPAPGPIRGPAPT